MRLDFALDEPRAPGPDDVLRSPRLDRRILDARPTESRVWSNRWTLTLGPGLPAGSLEPLRDGIVIDSFVYRRGEGPRDFFDPDG